MSFCGSANVCEPKLCEKPTDTENASIALTSQTQYSLGSKALLECNEGYVYDISGFASVSIELICIDDGKNTFWAGIETGEKYTGCRKGSFDL